MLHAARFRARSRITHHVSRFTCPAFTLVEILVTVALLSFIILGLFAMFNQVQRAFRSSMNQVDQLEAGRAVTEMLPRELEQIDPGGLPLSHGVNFYVQILNSTPLTQCAAGQHAGPPHESAGGLLPVAAPEPDLGRHWLLCPHQ